MPTNFLLNALVAVAALAWAGLLASKGWGIPVSFFTPFSTVTALMAALLLAYDRWLWRAPLLRLLQRRPDLRGTWRAVLSPDAPDPKAGKTQSVSAYLVIQQTFSALHLRLLTAESQSHTLAASLAPQADGAQELVALYLNRPRMSVRDRSEIHHGGMVLFIGGPPPNKMNGHYWTDRNTQGEVALELLSRTRVADFQTANVLFGPARGLS